MSSATSNLSEELSDLMRDLQDRKGHSEWLIRHWPTVMSALARSERTVVDGPSDECRRCGCWTVHMGCCKASERFDKEQSPCKYDVSSVLLCPMMKRQKDHDYHCLYCGLHVEVDPADKPSRSTNTRNGEVDLLMKRHRASSLEELVLDLEHDRRYHADQITHLALAIGAAGETSVDVVEKAIALARSATAQPTKKEGE